MCVIIAAPSRRVVSKVYYFSRRILWYKKVQWLDVEEKNTQLKNVIDSWICSSGYWHLNYAFLSCYFIQDLKWRLQFNKQCPAY